MKTITRKMLALTLAVVLTLTTSCSAGGPATTAAAGLRTTEDSCGTFYQDLVQLILQEGQEASGGFSAQSVQDRASCRVLAWTGSPLDLGGLEPESKLSRSSFHVLQFADQTQAKAALDKLTAQGVAASLDRAWNAAGGYSTGAIRTSGGTVSWGTNYSGLRHYGTHYAGTYQNQVTVAVLDSGIDFDHPYLSGCVDKARSVNLSGDRDQPKDENGHGTHVAGIVADGTQDAPVTLVSVKTQDSLGHGTDATLTAGLVYSMEQGFDVLNLSLGGGHSAVVDAAIQDCLRKGIVVVTSSGNDGEEINASDHCPAHMQDILVVGACDRNGKRCFFSNYGAAVDLLAPGQDINSSVPGGGWEEWSGTSMAAPVVSGAAALLLCREDLSPAQVEAALKRAVNEKGVLDMRLLLPEEETGGPSPEPTFIPAPEPTTEPAPAITPEPVSTPVPSQPEPADAPLQDGGYVSGQAYRYLGKSGVYTGQWSGGQPEGQGKLTFTGTGGQFRYLDGTWENGMFVQGVGEEPLDNGDVYVGGLARVMQDESHYAILWHGSGRFNLASGDWTETVYDMGEEVSTVYHTKDGQVFQF